VDENEIRSNASLARVRKLGLDNLVHSVGHVNSLVDNGGALSSELHDAGDHVLSGSLSDNLTDESRSSKANQIGLLVVEVNSDIDSSFAALDTVRIHVLIDKSVDDSRGGGRELRRLNDTAVSSRDGTDERLHSQREGVVPGSVHCDNT